jgi:hypothetical protein
MTMPNERTAAVLRAGEFLYRLVSPYREDGIKKIPKAVRQEALSVLRHYPSLVDMLTPETSFDPEYARDVLAKKLHEQDESV